MAAGEVREIAFEFRDIALKSSPKRHFARELIREEERCSAFRAVDRCRAAKDDPPERGGSLACREELERPDHVEVVERARRLSRFGVPKDPAVDNGVHLRRGAGAWKSGRP